MMQEQKNQNILSIYSKEIPDFLKEAMMTDSMKRIEHVGMHCGMEYTSFPFYSSLGKYSRAFHSLGVGLIIYHFTHSIQESLAGLFHDIATPCFAHVIDFLNHDYEKQESTEERTENILRNDPDILSLLKKYQLSIDDVKNYHRYPIADNDSPKLSSDRLEYTLSNFLNFSFATFEEVKEMYSSLQVSKNEWGEEEICFTDFAQAKKFTLLTLKNSMCYVSDCDRLGMEILARIIKQSIQEKIITYDDLYKEEDDLIKKLKQNPISQKDFEQFQSLSSILASNEKKENFIQISSKKRYIDPYIIHQGRISKLNQEVKEKIDEFLKFSFSTYLSVENIESFSFKKL